MNKVNNYNACFKWFTEESDYLHSVLLLFIDISLNYWMMSPCNYLDNSVAKQKTKSIHNFHHYKDYDENFMTVIVL